MNLVSFVLLIWAVALFALAGLPVVAGHSTRLIALGLACWAGSELILHHAIN